MVEALVGTLPADVGALRSKDRADTVAEAHCAIHDRIVGASDVSTHDGLQADSTLDVRIRGRLDPRYCLGCLCALHIDASHELANVLEAPRSVALLGALGRNGGELHAPRGLDLGHLLVLLRLLVGPVLDNRCRVLELLLKLQKSEDVIAILARLIRHVLVELERVHSLVRNRICAEILLHNLTLRHHIAPRAAAIHRGPLLSVHLQADDRIRSADCLPGVRCPVILFTCVDSITGVVRGQALSVRCCVHSIIWGEGLLS